MAFCGEGPHGSFSTGRPNGSFGTGRPGGPNGHGWARALSWRAGVYRSDHDAATTRSGGVLGHLAVMLVGAERLSDLAGLGPAGAARPGRLDPTARLVERVATDPRRVGVGIAVLRSNTAVRPNTPRWKGHGPAKGLVSLVAADG
jgi:hypothetical protein